MKKTYPIIFLSIFLLAVLASITYLIYTTIQTERDIIGTWESTQDSNYVITFTNTGEVYENYSDLNTEGTWVVTRRIDAVENFPVQYGYFLKTEIDNEEFIYTISEVNEDELILMYIPRGTTLSFIRKDVVE